MLGLRKHQSQLVHGGAMQEVQNSSPAVGILIDQVQIEITAARSKGIKIWEEKLKLWIRPCPRFVPRIVWYLLVKMVLRQTVQNGKSVMNPNGKA